MYTHEALVDGSFPYPAKELNRLQTKDAMDIKVKSNQETNPNTPSNPTGLGKVSD